jgi:hypothetical protein
MVLWDHSRFDIAVRLFRVIDKPFLFLYADRQSLPYQRYGKKHQIIQPNHFGGTT